jgi:hypothetical protein
MSRFTKQQSHKYVTQQKLSDHSISAIIDEMVTPLRVSSRSTAQNFNVISKWMYDEPRHSQIHTAAAQGKTRNHSTPYAITTVMYGKWQSVVESCEAQYYHTRAEQRTRGVTYTVLSMALSGKATSARNWYRLRPLAKSLVFPESAPGVRMRFRACRCATAMSMPASTARSCVSPRHTTAANCSSYLQGSHSGGRERSVSASQRV